MALEKRDLQVEMNFTLNFAGGNPGGLVKVEEGGCRVEGLEVGGAEAGRSEL